MSEDSHIVVHEGKCTTFVGPDAISYVRAESLAAALRLYAKAKILPTRGVSAKRLLELATGITSKKYKRGEYSNAADDVKKWADEMKAALPKVNSST